MFLDLGVSSPQLDDAERGFSFLRDGPLDMRMDPNPACRPKHGLTVQEREMARVIVRYGEERAARRIARAICAATTERRDSRTRQLADL